MILQICQMVNTFFNNLIQNQGHQSSVILFVGLAVAMDDFLMEQDEVPKGHYQRWTAAKWESVLNDISNTGFEAAKNIRKRNQEEVIDNDNRNGLGCKKTRLEKGW